MNLAVMNARSLAPKMYSLIEHFTEFELELAVISETRFVNGPVYYAVRDNLEHDSAIMLICCSRRNKKGRNILEEELGYSTRKIRFNWRTTHSGGRDASLLPPREIKQNTQANFCHWHLYATRPV